MSKWWKLIQSCSRITPSTWTSSRSCVKTVHWIRWDSETGSWSKLLTNKISSWWFHFFYFHPYLGKIPYLTNIFQKGWNHQPDKICYLWVKEPADHSRKRDMIFCFRKKRQSCGDSCGWNASKWPKISITFQLMRMIEIWISTLTEVSIQTKKTLRKIQAFFEIIETHFRSLRSREILFFSHYFLKNNQRAPTYIVIYGVKLTNSVPRYRCNF